MRALLVLVLLASAYIVQAGKRGRDTFKGQGSGRGSYNRGRGYSDRDRPEYYYYSRGSSSHGRRRRSKSDSRSPDRRRSSKQPAKELKDSPGYAEYKLQKAEAAAQQERRLQAQALAACLEERAGVAAAAALGMNHAQAAHQLGAPPQGIPPMPGQWVWQHPGQAQPQGAAQQQQVAQDCGADKDSLISVAVLKLLEAELGHFVDLGSDPLPVSELETKLAQAKGQGKLMDKIISRYGESGQVTPARLAGKAKIIAGLAKKLRF